MKLLPRECDKLLLHQAGFLAQKRLARGLRLNHSETTALIASVIAEMIRDGDHSGTFWPFLTVNKVSELMQVRDFPDLHHIDRTGAPWL